MTVIYIYASNNSKSSAILHFARLADATAMYPYAAIILLPINSSLNPLVSILVVLLRKVIITCLQ